SLYDPSEDGGAGLVSHKKQTTSYKLVETTGRILHSWEGTEEFGSIDQGWIVLRLV
ncbi:hypothetical protein HAX54_031212, partial [Datura stramonium]|nr:hypothetical protein [Datura stramonium]